jgi:AraC-like DNA-binding protein
VIGDRLSEIVQDNPTKSPSPSGPQFHNLASCLAHLLETARHELDGDREGAKALLNTVSNILKSEVERHSGANGSRPGALTEWQIVRLRAFIEENLHRNIGTGDLSAFAQQSRTHFSRTFKQAFGEPPHAYVVKRRLVRACHLMATSSESLSEIALSVGLADHSHFCNLFRRAFGQSPSAWRRERDTRTEIGEDGSIIAHLEDSTNKYAATLT